MAYQSLYRRYRPQKFAEVRGQDHLVRALRNAVVEGRVGHAYLFSGPRGTGKTSTARILAKVLNCENPVDGEPCGVCDSCQAIEHGSSFDVFELDAASNNGVDAIRSLIERAQLGSPGRTKVYILDEVHMLSTAASNALLKTLEEPPDHVVFVLATTDPQKVLPTIKSRTQHFEVHLLSAEELQALAEYIVGDAGLDVSPEAIDYVVRAGAGSARDMESALDQVAAAGGIPDDGDALDDLVEALCERDTGRALLAVDNALNTGRTPRVLGENLIARLRDVFLASMKSDLSRLPERDRERVMSQAERLGPAGATRALEVLGDSFVGIADAPDQRIPLEVALVRLTKPEADHSLESVVDRLERLERGLVSGAVAAPTAAAPHSHPHVEAAERADEAAERGAPGDPAALVDALDPDHHLAEADAAAASPAPAGPTTAGPEGQGPAHLARQQLAAKRQGAAPARGVPKKKAAPTAPTAPTAAPGPPSRRPPSAAPAAATADPAPAPAAGPDTTKPDPAAPAPPEPVPAAPAPAPVSGGAFPALEQLRDAWSVAILTTLTNKAKARFSGGRFVAVDGDLVQFGLPNAAHASRCEECRPEVEAALSSHFSTPIRLEIIVDGDAVAPRAPGRPAPLPDDDLDQAMDMSELVDAESTATSSVDRIAQVFPGVEVVEQPDDLSP
jgi:DNA polymerase-3 subunit gamma/tau